MTEPRDLVPTPGQTIGPFFGYALPFPGDHVLAPAGHPDTVRLRGRVLDGDGAPVPDALLELWQADPEGRPVRREGSLRRDGATFTGWGRASTRTDGGYDFVTLRPGPVDGGAPFFALTVFARGLLNRLFTRIYLPGYGDAQAADPLLSGLPEDRRRTLLAREEDGDLVWDLRLQGPDETVFLTYPRHRS